MIRRNTHIHIAENNSHRRGNDFKRRTTTQKGAQEGTELIQRQTPASSASGLREEHRTEPGFYEWNSAPLTCSQTRLHQGTWLTYRCSQVLLLEALHVGAATCILVSQMTASPPPCPANWDSPDASGSTQLPFLPESGPAVPKAHLGRPSSVQSPRPPQAAFRVTPCLQWHASLLHVLEAGVCSQGWLCPSLPSAALLGVPSRGTCCQDQNALRSL